LTLRFNKFLHNQAEVIRTVEQRRTNLTSTKVNKNKRSEFYTAIPTNDEDDVIDINVSIGNQYAHMQTNSVNKNQYFQDRTTAVQSIEKTMHDLSAMFSRLSHIIYEHREIINK
jgi:hypothetical protein